MTKSPKFRVTYKINGEIAIKNKPDTFIQLEYETYRILPDGSVSNWLETEFGMKGWKIVGIGVMRDTIRLELE